MNNLIPFKMKMMIVLMFCIFMTFSMIVYVMNLTEKCENNDEMCFQVSRNPLVKANYFFYNSHYNYSSMTSQILKPLFTSARRINWARSTTEGSYKKTKKLISDTHKVLNMSLNIPNSSLGSKVTGSLKQKQKLQEVSSENSVSPNKVISYHLFSNQSAMSSSSSPSPSVQKSSTYTDFPVNSGGLFKGDFIDQFNSSGNVYIERRKNVEFLCRKYFRGIHIPKINKLRLNHILIDEKHKIMYCYVPKVACTNWKRIFMVLTGKANNISEVVNLPSSDIHAKNLFKSLQNYSISEVQKITEEYTKFIFVRHPFERLLSAYRNKLEQHYDSSKYFQARFGKFIIKNFRKNPSNVSLEKGDDVTFAEFASYLISSDPTLYNEHWQRVTDLCHPCLINYDFIGKYETLLEDSNFLLQHLGLNVGFPVLPKPSTTALNLKKYFNTLEKSTIYKLYNIYEMDFRLFGYDLFNTTDWSNS